MPAHAAHSSLDDFALMDRIAQRDPAALQAFYERHSGLVFALGLRVLGNRADAEELLIDVFWEVWDRSARYDASRGSPLTYLSTLSRSRAVDRLRQRPKGKRVPLDGAMSMRESREGSAADKTFASEDASRVRAVLQSLDAPQRQALECAFFEGLSHVEIAEKLNKPLGTVKTYIRQGLIRMRDILRIDLRPDQKDARKELP